MVFALSRHMLQTVQIAGEKLCKVPWRLCLCCFQGDLAYFQMLVTSLLICNGRPIADRVETDIRSVPGFLGSDLWHESS